MIRELVSSLTLPTPCISESCITLPCGASKGFKKTFKALIKPFERPQRSVKIKFELIFSLRQGLGEEELKAVFFFIELVAYECIYNALMSDCPSKDQK